MNINSILHDKKFWALLITTFWLITLFIVQINSEAIADYDFPFLENPQLNTFTIVLSAILMEALAFNILGSVVSGIIEMYISNEQMQKFIPKNQFLALVSGAGLGLIFPVCECGVVAVVRRLIKKGLPLPIAISYMVATPIINPIVMISTIVATKLDWRIVIGRPVMGIIAAVAIGFLAGKIGGKESLFKSEKSGKLHSHEWEEDDQECIPNVECAENQTQKIMGVFQYASDDFFEIGKYLIIGATLAALLQSLVPREILNSISMNPILSILGMMLLAFVLSICSEADAFVARSFVQFSASAKLAFLVLGPMLDIKLVFMFFATFKKKLVLTLVIIMPIIVFILTYAYHFIFD